MVDEIHAELFGRETTLELSGEWAAYWLVILRVVVGLAFLHSGLGKLFSGLTYDAGGYLTHSTDHILGSVFTFVGSNLGVIMGTAVQYGEIAIGLGLILGCLLRTASFFGATLMVFFYMGSAPGALSHGMATGDLFYLLTFITVAVFAAGRVWGIDEVIEESPAVKNNPRLRYFLG